MLMKMVIPLLALLTVGCASAIKGGSETRLTTDLSVLDYNTINSRYMERPTFVSLVERVSDGEMLSIQVDHFGRDSHLYIPVEAAPEISSFIEKYLEWEQKALDRGDQVEKDIGKVDGWSAFSLRASFFSGNEENHFFVLKQCSLGCLSAETTYVYYFDHENAERLQELLAQMQSGEIQSLNADEVYQ